MQLSVVVIAYSNVVEAAAHVNTQQFIFKKSPVNIFQDLLSKSDGGIVVATVCATQFWKQTKLMPMTARLCLNHFEKPDCVRSTKEWQDLHVGFFLYLHDHRGEYLTICARAKKPKLGTPTPYIVLSLKKKQTNKQNK